MIRVSRRPHCLHACETSHLALGERALAASVGRSGGAINTAARRAEPTTPRDPGRPPRLPRRGSARKAVRLVSGLPAVKKLSNSTITHRRSSTPGSPCSLGFWSQSCAWINERIMAIRVRGSTGFARCSSNPAASALARLPCPAIPVIAMAIVLAPLSVSS